MSADKKVEFMTTERVEFIKFVNGMKREHILVAGVLFIRGDLPRARALEIIKAYI